MSALITQLHAAFHRPETPVYRLVAAEEQFSMTDYSNHSVFCVHDRAEKP